MTSGDLRPAGVALAAEVATALESGEPARAADLADDAACAFLTEQGEPNFDAPNMLRLGAHAHLLAGDHHSALDTLDRARPLAEPLPAGEPFDRLNVQLQRLRGEALLAAGDRPAARAELQAALERCLATLGSDDIDTAVIHNMLGIVGKFTGRFDDALTHYTRAGELFRAHGVGDDVLGVLHHNLGGLAHSRGDLQTAERETRCALELHTAAAGPAHPDSAADRGQLGAILSELGRHEEAERELRDTARDMAAAHGPDHVEVGIAYTAIGAALHRVGRLDESDAAYRRGLAIRERLQGAGHPELAPTLVNLSRLCEQRGEGEQALELARRAVHNLDGAVTGDHPILRAARERLAELGGNEA